MFYCKIAIKTAKKIDCEKELFKITEEFLIKSTINY